MILPRRTLITGLAAALAMPAFVRAENIMRVKVPAPPGIPPGHVRCLFDGYLVIHPGQGNSLKVLVGPGDTIPVPAGAAIQPVVEITSADFVAGKVIAAIEIGPGTRCVPQMLMPLPWAGYGDFSGLCA